MEVQSGRGALICVTVYVNRELVATFAPFGRERLGKWKEEGDKSPVSGGGDGPGLEALR